VKPRLTLHDFTQDNQVRGNKVHNQKQGHFSLFRSLLLADWAKDPIKLAVWIRLLSEASFRPRSVEFLNRDWQLKPGELVTTSTLLASRIHDHEGSPISKRHVLRILKFFERHNMIIMSNTPIALTIFITNYCDYQEVDPQFENRSRGTPLGTPDGTPHGTPNPSAGAGLKVVGGTPPGTPDGTPLGTQNNTDNNTDLKKIIKAKPKKTGSSAGSRSTMRPDAAVQSPSGLHWGTADDLTLAEWMGSLVERLGVKLKKPSWSGWANQVRLLRENESCDHQQIATVFKWANSDSFWQSVVLSPYKLRDHWQTVYLQCQAKSRNVKVGKHHNQLDFDNTDWAEGLEL